MHLKTESDSAVCLLARRSSHRSGAVMRKLEAPYCHGGWGKQPSSISDCSVCVCVCRLGIYITLWGLNIPLMRYIFDIVGTTFLVPTKDNSVL